ncbi:MATE family efflux transporter [Ferrimonas balearica]|uniref:MATE family efflux transporter n=1 Tax=Ferrimonas balearica TaxID=44012 RepID=UPI001C9954BD|nr:MATE family efflux transporter [Ferrimonas balearica]MBY5920485.1 MATE family efflux transporter [Ferrimonas balearica]MBY5996830.1 MATE family efflux transporter [Ferrimonas balearica]
MLNAGFQIKKLVQLALPVLIAQVAQTMMGLIDTVMAGRVGPADMAAVAVGTSLWLPTILLFAGIIMAMPPLISHLHGANEEGKIRPLVHQALYLALGSSVLTMVILANADLVLGRMDLEPALLHLSNGYLNAVLWGAPAFLLFQVLRSFTEGLSWTLPSMIIGFVGLAINIPANYIFIYGHFGMPAMGGAGCGVATALVYWGMLLAMVIYLAISGRFKSFELFKGFKAIDWNEQKAIVKLGLPVALAVFFEVTLFAFVAVMIAPLGSVVVAGHQVAANFSSIIFMLPLSIGIAVTIRVGYYLGRQQADIAAMVAKLGVWLGVAVALATALLTVLGREWIAHLYTNDEAVFALAVQLMFLCAFYQISDAIQVVSAAALRGYKDTVSILWIALVAFWGVGMTVGYVFGLTNWVVEPLGAHGFWIGFLSGLSFAALLLQLRLKQVQKRYVAVAA